MSSPHVLREDDTMPMIGSTARAVSVSSPSSGSSSSLTSKSSGKPDKALYGALGDDSEPAVATVPAVNTQPTTTTTTTIGTATGAAVVAPTSPVSPNDIVVSGSGTSPFASPLSRPRAVSWSDTEPGGRSGPGPDGVPVPDMPPVRRHWKPIAVVALVAMAIVIGLATGLTRRGQTPTTPTSETLHAESDIVPGAASCETNQYTCSSAATNSPCDVCNFATTYPMGIASARNLLARTVTVPAEQPTDTPNQFQASLWISNDLPDGCLAIRLGAAAGTGAVDDALPPTLVPADGPVVRVNVLTGTGVSTTFSGDEVYRHCETDEMRLWSDSPLRLSFVHVH